MLEVDPVNHVETYILQDVSGNVVGAVDPNDEYHVEQFFDPYGLWERVTSIWTTINGTSYVTLDPDDGVDDTTEYMWTTTGLHGHFYDRESGLYPMRARPLSPKWQRFLSQDPIGTGLLPVTSLSYGGMPIYVGVDVNPPSQFTDGLNPYQFVGSNPISLRDPSGLEASLLGQTIQASLQMGLMGMLFGSLGGVAGDMLVNPNSDWSSRGQGALRGGVGGFYAGASAGAYLAWSGIGGLAAMFSGGVIAGGVDAGVQAMWDGRTRAEVISETVSGGILGGVSSALIGKFLGGARAASTAAVEGRTTADMAVEGERRAMWTLTRAGYVHYDARLPGNRGFDGVFVKYDLAGRPVDIIITESKYSSTGYAYLRDTKRMGQQLSTQWIDKNIRNMIESANPELRKTGEFLLQNRGLIRTKWNILGPDDINRWSH